MNKNEEGSNKKPFKLIACKVFMRARVSSAAKAAASILLDRMNARSLRCDPSIAGIEGLTGYSRSTVQSGLRSLVKEGLLIVHRHGGLSARNSYEFCWEEIDRRDAAFQEALFSRRNPPRNQGVARPENRAQTLTNNPKNKPERIDALTEPSASREITKGQPRQERSCRRLPAPQRTSSAQAAANAAERRWNDDLLECFSDDHSVYAVAVELVDVTIQEAATEAEVKRRGDGLRTVLDHVRRIRPGLLEERRHCDRRDEPRVLPGLAPGAVISDPDLTPVRLDESRPDDPLTNLTDPDDSEEIDQ